MVELIGLGGYLSVWLMQAYKCNTASQSTKIEGFNRYFE
jgi:hypothetical protein